MAVRRIGHWLFSVSDHRGRRYSVLAPLRAHRQHSPRTSRIVGDLIPVFFIAMFAVFLYFQVKLAIMFLTPLVPGMGPMAAGLGYGILAAVAVMVLGAALAIPLIMRSDAHSNLRRQLLGRICPGCGYSFEGLEPEGDGCTVCPECEGAWRIASRPRKYTAPLPRRPLTARPGLAGAIRAWWQARTTITDDAGTLWAAGAPALVERRRQPPAARVSQGLAQGLLALGGLIGVQMVLLTIFWLAFGIAGYEELPAWVGPVSLPLAIAALVIVVVALSGKDEPRQIAELLRLGVCPICGRDLGELTGTADGSAVECPDCRSVWVPENHTHRSHAPQPRHLDPALARGPLGALRRRCWHAITTVPDHRGTRWPLSAPGNNWNARISEWRKLRRTCLGVAAAGVGLLVLWLALVFLFELASDNLESDDLLPWTAPTAFALACLGVLTGGLIAVRRSSRRCIRRLLRAGACPICAAELDASARGPDGLAECADCRSAWRVPAQGEP